MDDKALIIDDDVDEEEDKKKTIESDDDDSSIDEECLFLIPRVISIGCLCISFFIGIPAQRDSLCFDNNDSSSCDNDDDDNDNGCNPNDYYAFLVLCPLPAMLLLQTACCCAMNKWSLITASVISTVTGAGELLFSIRLIDGLERKTDFCDNIDDPTNNKYHGGCNDDVILIDEEEDYYYYYYTTTNNNNNNHGCDVIEEDYMKYITFSVTLGILWLIAGIFVFVFAQNRSCM